MFPNPPAGQDGLGNHNGYPDFGLFPPPLDLNQLSDQLAERVIDRVAERVTAQVVEGMTEQVVAGVSEHVADLIASQHEANEGLASTQGDKKRKERCGAIQVRQQSIQSQTICSPCYTSAS